MSALVNTSETERVRCCRYTRQTSNVACASTDGPEAGSATQPPEQATIKVDVMMDDAMEQLTVPVTSEASRIIMATLEFPLGIVLEGVLSKCMHACIAACMHVQRQASCRISPKSPLPIMCAASDDGSSVIVSEVTAGGSAEAAGVAVGDRLRASTAAMMQMTYPPINVMFGGAPW